MIHSGKTFIKTAPPLCLGLCTCLLLGALLASCARIPPTRQLPTTIRTLYVPMAINESYEPGVTEVLTRRVQEEFLRDGQIKVGNRSRADMLLEIILKTYRPRTDRIDSDRFKSSTEVTMIADVFLYDIDDENKTNPIFSWTELEFEFRFPSDPRRTIDFLDVDGRRDAIHALAAQIVATVLYFPSDEALEEDEDAPQRTVIRRSLPGGY